MARLFIPVGIPGCGKSTWAAMWHRPHSLYIVGTDTIRQQMVNKGELCSISDMSRNKDVFKRFHNDIEFHLHSCCDVIADATNLHASAREQLCEIAGRNDAEVHLIVFNNLNEAIGRNNKRDRVVPADVMIRMLEQYEKALRDIPTETYSSVMCIESLT